VEPGDRHISVDHPGLPVATYWWMAVVGTIGLFFSIVFHELAHSLIARSFAMPISGITLFIFGGVAELHSEPTSPRSEFLMAVAGPVASLVLGTALLGDRRARGRAAQPLAGVLWYLRLHQLGAGDLQPRAGLPLDGGRMLRAALWAWKERSAMGANIAANAGAGIRHPADRMGCFPAGDGQCGRWDVAVLIGMFLHGAAGAARQQMIARETFAGRPVARFMKRQPITVAPDLPLRPAHRGLFLSLSPQGLSGGAERQVLGCVTADRRGRFRRRNGKAARCAML